MDLSGYILETLHQDSESVLFRGRAVVSPSLYPPSVLVSMLTSEHPRPHRVRMLERELALRSELDPAWAVRPLAIAQHQARVALISRTSRANRWPVASKYGRSAPEHRLGRR